MTSIVLVVALVLLWRELDRLRRRVVDLERSVGAGSPGAGQGVVPESRPSIAVVEAPDDAGRAPPRRERLPVEEARADSRPEVVEPSASWKTDAEAWSGATTRGFEDLFGRRLPVWAGGITLAVAGVLIVKLSIESGMMTPLVRVVMSALFGIGLVAMAQASHSMGMAERDPRIPQALAGAGVATLYGAVLMASLGYGLIGQGAAFALSTAVTVGAACLSLRFGSACAVLGLAGGMAAPTLAGIGRESVPLVSVYLALVVAGLVSVARHRGWWWLGSLAMGGGLLWTLFLALHGDGGAASVSTAVLIAMLAFGVPRAFGAESRPWMRLGGGVVGCVQIVVLVAAGGFGMLQWGIYGVMSALAVWLASRDMAMRHLPAIGLGTVSGLLVMWQGAEWMDALPVLAGIAAIYGGFGSWDAWRNERIQGAWLACATAVAVSASALAMFRGQESAVAAVGIGMSGLLGGAALVGLSDGRRTEDVRFSIMVGVASALLAASMTLLFGHEVLAGCAALAAVSLVLVARPLEDARLGWWGAAFACASVVGAAEPIATWSSAGLLALGGDAFAPSRAPATRDVAGMLVPAVIALGAVALRLDASRSARRGFAVVCGMLSAVAVHSVWKATVGAMLYADGYRLSYLDRTLWEAALVAGAALAVARGRRIIGLVMGAAALAHFAWFSMIVESPLIQEQAVGALLAASFAIAGLCVWGSRSAWTGKEADRVRAAAGIVLVTAFSFIQLRQAVNGTLPLWSGTSPAEGVMRSFMAVLLGVGYLVWGLASGGREWRVASLGMMLFAAVKVFVFDVSGLDGLARIGTFVALGFSLIGIGWIYSRYLPERSQAANGTVTR